MDRSGRRAALAAVSAVCVALGLAACGGDDKGGGDGGGGGTEQKETKIGAALIGPKNDKAFNQSAFEGLQQSVKELPGLKLSAVLENRDTDKARSDAIETLAPNNDLIVGVSASFGPVFDVQAPRFPDKYFIGVAGYTKQFHENVTGLANDWGAPAYVVGVAAAELTKSNTIGYVGGAEIPPTIHAQAGFEAGAKSVKPDVKILKNVIGTFDDVAKAKSATAAMIQDGADVIFSFVDAGFPGSVAAAKESGKNPALVKIVIPECETYDNMLGTEIVNNKGMVHRMLKERVEGRLKPGAIFLDLQSPDLQTFELCPKYEKDEKLASRVKETIDGINAGDIKLPADALNPRPDYPHKEGFEGEMKGSGG